MWSRFPTRDPHKKLVPEVCNIILQCLTSGSMALCGLDSPFRDPHKKVVPGVFNIILQCLIAGSMALCGPDSLRGILHSDGGGGQVPQHQGNHPLPCALIQN
jgi:hypothetical protein